MARVTFINAILSGKLAGTTYSRNKAGYYIKQWTDPNDPKSQAQQSNRISMVAAASQWHALSDQKKQLWTSYANNIFVAKGGAGSVVSGFNAFTATYRTWHHADFMKRVATFTAPGTTTGVFTDFTWDDTPPIAALAGAIQTSTGSPLPITLTSVALTAADYTLEATFTMAGVLVAVPKFLDATSSKPVGIMLQMSIPQVQTQGFVQGKNIQTLGVMEPVTLTNASWTGNILTLAFASTDSKISTFKTAIQEDQVVSVNAYLVSANGEQKHIGSCMVTAV